MSMPNIPDIKPDIILNREDVVNLLLTSIALEDISFSHIINAEAEKIQHFLKDKSLSLKDAITVNTSVEKMMRGILTNQMLMLHKLGDIMKIIDTFYDDPGHYSQESDVCGSSCNHDFEQCCKCGRYDEDNYEE
ncbi:MULTISPECIES: hypothetical protein [unclassified Paenibacillus]|uniref:hypothetical protein n=1 Tax=unclassified Paenibacillus TaxID=185978 RepID=UPI002F42BF81